MKKIVFCLLISIACYSANAQLAKTKWIGTLQVGELVDVTLSFSKDTLTAITTADEQLLEEMTYKIKGNEIIITKTYGQSDCGYDIAGKYRFEIKKEEMEFTLVEDACYNRSSILDKSTWIKQVIK